MLSQLIIFFEYLHFQKDNYEIAFLFRLQLSICKTKFSNNNLEKNPISAYKKKLQIDIAQMDKNQVSIVYVVTIAINGNSIIPLTRYI